MELADLIAKGATAEAMVRTVAELTESDWQEQLTIYGDPATGDLDRERAYGKLLAIAPYRALFTSAVEIWDREAPVSTPAVHIVDSR